MSTASVLATFVCIIDADHGIRMRNVDLQTKGLAVNVKQGTALLVEKMAFACATQICKPKA
ncbi:MAG: hypothetical protein ACSLEM_05340 [Candidatus Malihini olakiniferum]